MWKSPVYDHIEQQLGLRRLALPAARVHCLQKLRVVVVGAFGGRLDQQMQGLNSLFHWQDSFASLVLADQSSFAALLPGPCDTTSSAQSFIHRNGWQDGTCGIIPICGSATVTSQGLKWELCDSITAFGGLVSTSNCMTSDLVTFTSSTALVWTASWTIPW